jgi:tRNA pseudouridine38-40 synthase
VTQLPLDSPPPASDSERVLELTVAYDGTDFHGFAAQRDHRTVERELTAVLERVLQAPVDLGCAGRTDAGVHAWGQVVSCRVPGSWDDARVAQLRRAVNGQLAPEVVVRAATVAAAGFDARRSARSRSYRYTIVNRDVPDPFRARTSWWVPGPLDLTLLRLGADPFLGEHDFASFCRSGPPGSTTVRRVLESRWCEVDDGVLRYDITATAFCWQMVRSIVGTLVDVGVGKLTPGDVLGILRARDRAAAGRVAPPEGLCLWSVAY